MLDPYSVLGISQGADDETIKKAYRQKCKQYHPDLHPDDPTCEDKFKEVQAAYSEIMREKQGGGSSGARSSGYSSYSGYGSTGQRTYGQSGQSSDYQDPFGFGFGFDPFGFGFGYSGGGQYSGQSTGRRDTPEMQAANNYIRNGYYQEALNVLEGIAANERSARWHYYAALACAGLGNNIRAQNEARTAVDMEPGNYEYQNLLDRLQNPGRTYRTYQQTYTQPGGGNPLVRFCLTLWIAQMFFSLLSCCCCGGRGGYYC
ncbi:DnaJ domain-containing protein [Subdoligranulum sp. DSM 109015]|uniref:DnaJ domain-containing protein n=1 Tax=Gemmiger gallinarum TaxID=2779354 RepID=A0ABR9R1G2_9FIRM|nr:DnaJ domain-containing protein [Gemmiger gallinarum]MBE5036943.1 DnaJ domain-containing protein [Gemmiger gallinarum]